MPVKLTLTQEEFAALPEERQADYETVGDVIQIAGLSAWGESHDAIGGLKSALQKERENAEAARKQRHDLKVELESAGGATAEELAAAEARAEEIERNANEQLAALKKDLQTARVDREISEAIMEHRGTAPLRDVLKTHVKVDDQGAAYVQVEDKKLCVSEYAASLKQDPVYHSVFQGSGHSGGSTPAGSANGRTPSDIGVHPASRSEMDASAKAAYISQHGINAFMEIPA